MQGMQIANFFSQAEYQIEVIEFADGSTFNLIKGLALTGNDDDENISGTAYNSFVTDTSSSMDNLSNPTEDVSDIYSLAASQDLTRKAI